MELHNAKCPVFYRPNPPHTGTKHLVSSAPTAMDLDIGKRPLNCGSVPKVVEHSLPVMYPLNYLSKKISEL